MYLMKAIRNSNPSNSQSPMGSRNIKAFLMALLFLTATISAGCIVHHKHPGRGHGHYRGHGHHKGKHKVRGVYVRPKAEISVSPFVVIDD